MKTQDIIKTQIIMTRETDLLLHILRDNLQGKKTDSVSADGVNWSELSRLAHSHQLSQIVYYQCKDFMPSEIKKAFRQEYLIALAAYEKRDQFLAQFDKALGEAGIKHIVVKGPTIAAFYPQPPLRSMGDIDFIVSPPSDDDAARLAAEKILLSQGWIAGDKETCDEWHYEREGIELELHDELVYKANPIYKDELYRSFYNDFWQSEQYAQYKDEFTFLVAFRHLRKHFVSSGVGFRHFYDLAVIAAASNKAQTALDAQTAPDAQIAAEAQATPDAQLDWTFIEEKLTAFGFAGFAGTIFALCEKWFGVEFPILKKEMIDEFALRATDFIASNGVFGFENKSNYDLHETNAILAKEDHTAAKTKSALSKFFPGYEQLRKKYKFIDGRPYLLPVGWIVRAVSGVSKGKTGDAINAAKKELVPKEKIEAREKLYNDWKL